MVFRNNSRFHKIPLNNDDREIMKLAIFNCCKKWKRAVYMDQINDKQRCHTCSRWVMRHNLCQSSRNGVNDGSVRSNALQETVAEHGRHLGRGLLIIRFNRPNVRIVEQVFFHISW